MSWVQLGRLYSRHGHCEPLLPPCLLLLTSGFAHSNTPPATDPTLRPTPPTNLKQPAASLAQRCYEQARSVEPTAVAVWEGMAAAAAARAAPGAARDAADAAEHAVGLGGGPESWEGFAAGAIRAGRAGEGAVLACAAKSAAAAPLLPAAHNSYGLACEARGVHADAARAFRRALALLQGGESGGIADSAAAGDAPYSLPLAGAAADAGGPAASPAALAAALQLNLGRALVRAGRGGEALEIYRDLEAAGALTGQPYAWICRAFAARDAGEGPAAVAAALQAALREARDVEATYHAVLASLQVRWLGRVLAGQGIH
jgi:hypothetical protein